MASAGVAHSSAAAAVEAAAGGDAATPNVIASPHPPASSPTAAVDEAWGSLISIIDGFPASLGPLPTARDEETRRSLVTGKLSVLRTGGLLEVLRAYVLSVLDRKVRTEVTPLFWAILDVPVRAGGVDSSSGGGGGGGGGGAEGQGHEG
ncbi:unnamed protein product, partial [Ectocarpus sp. 12 AP-2014]